MKGASIMNTLVILFLLSIASCFSTPATAWDTAVPDYGSSAYERRMEQAKNFREMVVRLTRSQRVTLTDGMSSLGKETLRSKPAETLPNGRTETAMDNAAVTTAGTAAGLCTGASDLS
jgi:hypothetical protein